MTDIDNAHPTSRELTSGADVFSSYGARVGTTGQFLSFKNGEFLYGQDATELPIGTRLIANMEGLRLGWRRWFGGQVTDDRTSLLTEREPIPRREELGDNDKAMWERDAPTPQNPNPPARDPWQYTNILELSSSEETFIYSTSSKGGIGAIGRLCKAYGHERRQRPGMVPVVELARDFYNHKTFGKTYFPEFNIVGWTDENNPSVEGDNEDELPFDKPAAKVSTAPSPAPTTQTQARTRF